MRYVKASLVFERARNCLWRCNYCHYITSINFQEQENWWLIQYTKLIQLSTPAEYLNDLPWEKKKRVWPFNQASMCHLLSVGEVRVPIYQCFFPIFIAKPRASLAHEQLGSVQLLIIKLFVAHNSFICQLWHYSSKTYHSQVWCWNMRNYNQHTVTCCLAVASFHKAKYSPTYAEPRFKDLFFVGSFFSS